MWPLECKQEFPIIWPGDLVFLPEMTHIQTWPRYCQDKHSDKVLLKSGRKSGLYSVNKNFLRFDLVT